MRRLVAIPLAVALTVLGFAAGYAYRAFDMPVNAELEDYALSNILQDVGYVHYLAKGDFASMRSLLDVNLNGHVSRAREHSGALKGIEADVARTRTLNAVAVIWDRYPPFQSSEWKENESSFWWREWAEDHRRNLALVRTAKEKCTNTPALKCRAHPPESLLPIGEK